MVRPKRTELKIKKKTLNLFAGINKVLAPPPELTVSQWADEFRRLSAESSAEPGKWRTDRAPYQREIMDAVSSKEHDTVIIMSSAQVGKTEILNNIVGYHIDYDPAPLMVIQPTKEMAQTYSKKRLAPMLRDTPALSGKVKDAKSRDSDNTLLEKGFPGGYIVMVGANSPSSLASRPIRVLLADEVDRFGESAKDEGDPLSLAEKRLKTFWNRKKVFVSTPTIKGKSRIETEYNGSTMEQWSLPCPDCGRHQPIDFEQIIFKHDEVDSSYIVYDVVMQCKFCKSEYTEHEWKAGRGAWFARKPNATKRGFHLNAFASPWEPWENIIADFLDAKRKGKEVLKVWVNTMLGETWDEDGGETVSDEMLLKRRETYNCEVPEGVIVLTAGVDVQDDRIECEVVGWGFEKESWGIYYKSFMGDPAFQDVWNDLDLFLKRRFKTESGLELQIGCVCIDSGGHKTQETYKFTKARELRRVYSIKGYGGPGRPLVGRFSRNNREKAVLFPLGVDQGKDSIFTSLQVVNMGPGFSHFPLEPDRGYDADYFKMLTAEKKVIRFERGITKISWIKLRKRNEALDIRNYALAAFEILIPDEQILEQLKRNPNVVNSSSPGRSKKKKRRVHGGV